MNTHFFFQSGKKFNKNETVYSVTCNDSLLLYYNEHNVLNSLCLNKIHFYPGKVSKAQMGGIEYKNREKGERNRK